jgi:phosphoglycolate phosphatase-like HAD superfamily hydrolase
MKILLFDIDGTLMLSGGAGRRAIDRAFFELYGITDAFGEVVPDGNTDPKIFSEIMANHRLVVEDEAAAFAFLADRYAEHMRDEMRRSEGAHLMPGVGRLLELLATRTDLGLGLLTGNFETTARIKLDRFGLNPVFPFGAFSSDHAEREALVPIAVGRAEEHFGRPIGLGRHVVVIGDTPKDVECALAHEATAVGVAASRYSVRDLESAGAHLALPSLENPAALLEAVDSFETKSDPCRETAD